MMQKNSVENKYENHYVGKKKQYNYAINFVICFVIKNEKKIKISDFRIS